MIGYITVGSNDLTASGVFYDELLSSLHASRAYTQTNMIAYSFGDQRPMVVTLPNDGKPATNGNGTMVALMASDRAHVDTVHALALRLGAKDAGQPASYQGQFYGGYSRDPDGNKFCVFIMQNA